MCCWGTKRVLLNFVIIGVIISFCLGHAAKAQEKGVKSTVKIELSGGQTKSLSSPLTIKGKFTTENFTVPYVSLERIENAFSGQKRQGDNTFLLKLPGDEKAIQGSFPIDAKLTGSGEWGQETVAMSSIRSIQITNRGNAKPFEPASKWRCTFSNGEQLLIGWTSEWSSDRAFIGQIGGGSLTLDVQQIANLTLNDSSWTLTGKDGFSLEGWQPKDKSLSASSTFGEVQLAWSKIAKLSHESVSSKDVAKKIKTPLSRDWLIEIDGRIVLPVGEIRTGKEGMINGELKVESLNWQFIDSALPKPTGLQLNLSDKTSWMLQGTISGNTPVGKMGTSIEHITKVARITPFPKDRVPSDYNKRLVATIITMSGSEYPVGDPSLEGENAVSTDSAFFGFGLFRASTPPVEMWLSSNSLLSARLSTVDGKLVSHSQNFERHGPLGGFTGIAFCNSGGKFVLPISKMAEYSPQGSPSQGSPSKSQQPIFSILVKDGTGKQFTAKASSIEFARYPRLGWSGTYYKPSYPFQWHRANVLYFKKESGERIDVHFDKIKSIHISDYSGSRRSATLTSTQDSQMRGSIYPGDVTKSYPGISEWDPAKEGLLCQVMDRTYMYVAFRKGITIDIYPASTE